jgi:hypothetical protein
MKTVEKRQLHLVLSYKHEPARHPRVAALLSEGYRIEQFQRITDHEVFVTLARERSPEAVA